MDPEKVNWLAAVHSTDYLVQGKPSSPWVVTYMQKGRGNDAGFLQGGVRAEDRVHDIQHAMTDLRDEEPNCSAAILPVVVSVRSPGMSATPQIFPAHYNLLEGG